MDTASLASMRPKDWTRHILGLVSTQAVKTRNQKFIIDLKHRVLDLDPRTVDEVYGLEPVFEPDAGGPGAGSAALGEFVELQCPYCGEVYGTPIDLTDRSRVYIEDCQICCQPIEVTLEVSDAGELLRAETARAD